MYPEFITVGSLFILMLSTFASDYIIAGTILVSPRCHLKCPKLFLVSVRVFQV